MTKTIMLIHGAWLNSMSWEKWKAYYEGKGFTVVTPDWPYDDRPPAELRANPHPMLKTVGVKGVVDHLEAAIDDLAEEPILMGHSAGGVFTQILLNRGRGVVGVAIDPAPTTGAPIGPHALLSAFPVLGSLGSWNRVMHMSRKFFATRFAQTIPAGHSDALYDRYIVPTAGKVYWDGILSSVGKIRWDNPDRAPLLLIGGGRDLIADPSMTRAIYNRQKRAPSSTELRIFPERSHWTCMDPGWEAVADYALDWALQHAPQDGTNVTRLADRAA